MESIMYFILLSVCAVQFLQITSLLLIAIGVIWLVIARVRSKKTGERKSVRMQASLLALGCIIFLTVSIGTWGVTNYIEQEMTQVSQKYEGATCVKLSVSDGYRFQATKFRDGTYAASLEKYDGSQSYITGITQYVFVNEYMLGIIGPEDSPYYWFWFNMKANKAGRYFENREDFIASLPEIGFAEEPILLPVSVHCEREGCPPCPTLSVP